LMYPLVFHPLRFDASTPILEEEHITVTSFPLKHSIPTCGFLFREKNPPRRILVPRSYAYCSDTAYSESILPVIQQVGLVYHEATFMQDMAAVAAEKMHSTTIEAATIARKANAGKLIIGHFSARYEELAPLIEEARSVFPETYPATEGLSLPVD